MRRSSQHNRIEVRQRIITRLYALAELCERVTILPAPIRFMVLWMLRSGEVIVRDYVAGVAFDAGYQLRLSDVPTAWQGSGPDDAMRLALQLRVLADVLGMLLWVESPRLRDAEHASIRLLLSGGLGSAFQAFDRFDLRMPVPDTS